ncbi:unnamed protein product, partial [marine sediment metagenome]
PPPYADNTQGFTFNDFMAEIDAGRPVLIQVAGHSMLGYGYNTTGNIVYIHDTWDYSDHQMTWGGTYSELELQHYGVTVLQLAPAVPPSVTTNDASSITHSSATLNGNLTSLGGYSPVNVSFEWGTAPGVYSDNTTPEAMTSIGVFSDNLSGLAPSTTYYFRAKATGSATVYGAELSFTTPKVLTSIDITPDDPTIALGRTQQFTATGTYSDASTDNITGTVTWASDNTTVATMGATAGLAQSLAEGQTTISATLGAISDNTTLTVGPKVIDSIAVTPESVSVSPGTDAAIYRYWNVLR